MRWPAAARLSLLILLTPLRPAAPPLTHQPMLLAASLRTAPLSAASPLRIKPPALPAVPLRGAASCHPRILFSSFASRRPLTLPPVDCVTSFVRGVCARASYARSAPRRMPCSTARPPNASRCAGGHASATPGAARTLRTATWSPWQTGTEAVARLSSVAEPCTTAGSLGRRRLPHGERGCAAAPSTVGACGAPHACMREGGPPPADAGCAMSSPRCIRA